MKRILVGLIALGLAMGLMFSCVLNPSESAEITTKSGVAETDGTVSGDIVFQVKDASGNVTEQFTWAADGTWTWETYAFESSDDTADGDTTGDRDGTAGEGVYYQNNGLKGTYSYDASTKRLTVSWMGNDYDALDAGEGYAWTGDWGGEFNDADNDYAVNSSQATLGLGALTLIKTVDFSNVLGATPGTFDVTGAPFVGSAANFLTGFNDLYVDGTYYEEKQTYSSTESDGTPKTGKTVTTVDVSIDNAAGTFTFTAEEYDYDEDGEQIDADGETGVYSFVDPMVYVPDEDTFDPDDETTESTSEDVSAVSDNKYSIILWEELQEDSDSDTDGSLSYTLDDGAYRNTAGWTIDATIDVPGYTADIDDGLDTDDDDAFEQFMVTSAGIVIVVY